MLVTPTYLAILIYAVVAAILALATRWRPASMPMVGGSAAKVQSTLRRIVPIAFLLSSGALLLFGRRAVLRYDPILNPDEALFAAAAMRTRHGWLNWDIADTTSSGPLNAAILAWPYLFGGDITLFSTRLTGVVCVYASVAFIYLALRRLSDDGMAIIVTVPAFILFSATTSSELIHYSSEQLPICLLAGAFYFLVRSFENEKLRYPLGAALVLGLVPFAKLQAAPIAAVMGDQTWAQRIESLALAIAGDDPGHSRLEEARIIAEAELDLVRVRVARTCLLELTGIARLARPQPKPRKARSAAPPPEPGPDDRRYLAGGEEILPALEQMILLDRYDRRALARRNRAIQRLL